MNPTKVTMASLLILLAFLFVGSPLLGIFGIDVSSFAIAGSFIIFLIAMEMILGIELFKQDAHGNSSAIFPIAFPLIAGAGSITTILSLMNMRQSIYCCPFSVYDCLSCFKTYHCLKRSLARRPADP